MMLLAAAGLLIRSFILLQRVDPGFDSSHLAVVRLSLPDSRYPELTERTQFVNSVLERLRALAGVQSVAAAGTLPFDPVPSTDLELEGHAYEPGNEPEAEILTASPEYFRTMGIRLLAGRTFTPQDIAGRATAVVINQTMAQRFWPGKSALGKRVVMKDWGPPLPGEVVGVVSDVKQDSAGNGYPAGNLLQLRPVFPGHVDHLPHRAIGSRCAYSFGVPFGIRSGRLIATNPSE